MIGYRLQSRQLNDLIKRAEAVGQKDEIGLVGSRAAANVTRDHLFALDERGNKFGAVRTHFYSSAAKSVTEPQVRGGVVAFDITKLGLALRWLGGIVRAGVGTSSVTGGPTKYLAVPARTETRGVPPSEFPDLQFVPRRGGGGMLVQALQTQVSITGKKKKTVTRGSEVGGLVMYWLCTETKHAPDPSVMPTKEQLVESAAEAMSSYLSRRLSS